MSRPPGPHRFCGFEGCDRRHAARGFCHSHWRQSRSGSPLRPLRDYANPYGSGHTRKDGYRVLYRPSHPNARAKGDVLEHVFVMSEALGRPLRPGENVHHINGVKDDNRPDNLELWVTSQPKGQRPQDLVAWAKEIITLYEKELAHESNGS